MPPPFLVDLSQLDLTAVCLTREQIYGLLPHRYEFMLLDGVCFVDKAARRIVGFAELEPGDWWCRGHIPGRTLLPGVLMLEMAAQLAATLAKLSGGYDTFIAFGGVDQCKFREPLVPPTRLYIISTGLEHRARRIRSATQGVADGKLIFEATVTGLTMPESGTAPVNELLSQ